MRVRFTRPWVRTETTAVTYAAGQIADVPDAVAAEVIGRDAAEAVGPDPVYRLAFPPTALTATDAGPAVDLDATANPVRVCVTVGGLAPGTGVSVQAEQSATGTGGWAAVGPPVVGAADSAGFAEFTRTQRYARVAVTLTGPTPAADVAAVFHTSLT
jgi:hypothetical protein